MSGVGKGNAAIVKALQSAHALYQSGKADDAIAVIRRAIAKGPAHIDGARMLSQMLLAQGRVEEARFALSRALQAHGSDASLLLVAAEVAAMDGKSDAALVALDRALGASPGLPRALALRGRLLMGPGRYTEAVGDLRAAAEALPGEPEHRNNLALALLATAHAPEACELLQALCREQPGFLPARATLALAMNYHPSATGRQIFEAHLAYGELCESQHAPMPVGSDAPRSGGPVRVGFFSRDLRRHSCAYFLLPILENLDRSRFEPVAYMDDPHADEMTERFRTLFGEGNWRETSRLSNAAVAEAIRADGVGLLLDLGSHFFGNRLAVMALQPAPASASYLGYPNTTGLSRVSARIVDSVTDPMGDADGRGGADALATERLIRVDHGGEPAPLWCYRPDEGLPAAEPLGADEPFVFVSFNDLKKINDPLLDDWATILTRVPTARLILKTGALRDEPVRAELQRRLSRRGIEAGRVRLLGYVESHGEHLGLYAGAHAALDTHPYCGTTTTLEAAWMGVPTLTLAPEADGVPDPRHAARVGASLNTALGLGEYITASREQYIERAVGLAESFARDAAPLNGLRLGLRARFEASSLRDEAGFARRFEAALDGVIRVSNEG